MPLMVPPASFHGKGITCSRNLATPAAMKKSLLSSALLIVFFNCVVAQQLKPGFDKEEYIRLMRVSSQFGDSAYAARLPPFAGYKLLYRSPVMGLDNKWDLWQTDHNVPVISIRGTTADQVSWLANFYAAMVPAKGSLQLSSDDTFDYELAKNPKAYVHVGWLLSTGFLVKDILPKIDSLYHAGNHEILIMGHSQGGAIAYLLTAYLYHLQQADRLSKDIRFKTYCSAAPKPGNLYFAYEYEAMTQAGWAYNVVNSADWVPETPVSIQTANDFNELNPFSNARGVINKQGLLKRVALNYAYGKLTKYNNKAVKSYKKYLGSYVVKSIKKHLPGFVEPQYAPSNNYVRTGTTITLLADDDYFKVFPQDKQKVFTNHFHSAYLYLINKSSL